MVHILSNLPVSLGNLSRGMTGTVNGSYSTKFTCLLAMSRGRSLREVSLLVHILSNSPVSLATLAEV